MSSPASLEAIRHSLAHLLAAAVSKRFSDVRLGIGPVIENGFYYDFLLPHQIVPEDLSKLEEDMRALIKQNLPFTREMADVSTARRSFADQPFKLELIHDLEEAGEKISLYHTGDAFTDLCAGGHVETTDAIPLDAFRLTKIAGAYWKGNEENTMLTRVYGVAFNMKRELDAYLAMLEEAERRDHKKLGIELDLFAFSPLVGGGLPLFTPRGTFIREALTDFVQSLQTPRGYERVSIPHITKRALYETSGHWQKFKDELFKIITREGHEFAMKPMNCPHHTQIYASRKRSYRDLPIRYSEVTMVYRDEQSGELSGLSRVRSITQDDGHVFCRMNQVTAEAFSIWDIIDEFYAAFRMPLTVRFSRHDPAHMEKYLGTPEVWKAAEEQLLALIKERGVAYIDGPGEAAMYGPKIDFIAKDSLGREWQLATIQLDFNLPERFHLAYVNEEGIDEQVVMIHRAILGSIERFLSILIEHYAGDFPLWLSPVQVRILPIGAAHEEYAELVRKRCIKLGIRAEVAASGETLGKRIRAAELGKIPYIAVVGDKELEGNLIGLRARHQEKTETISLDETVQRLEAEIAERK